MQRHRGFILATTLLVMTLLTVMLIAAFVMISAEFRTTNGSYSTSRSLNLAQAGLQSYFAFAHSLGTGSDSLNYAFPGGYARTVARRVRDSTTSERALWIVYSTGVDSTGSITVQGTGQRVVAQLANLDPGRLPARAAIVAANGVQMQGSGSNPIDGTNHGTTTPGCTIPVGAAADTVGLTIPTLASYSGPQTPYPLGEGTNGMEALGSATTVIDSTHIDWVKLVNGEFTPDYYNTFPSWPPANTTYQTHYFTGNATIPNGQRRGLLVVKGDVTLASGAHWDGVIVAGGMLNTPSSGSSTYTIHGMIITGLNISLGQSVIANQIRRGSARSIRWDFCYSRSAVASLSYLVPIRGTYVDTWKTY